jgi:hypothetical protein
MAIKLIQSKNDITLEQYIKVISIVNNSELATEAERAHRILEELYGIPKEEIELLNTCEIKKMMDSIYVLSSPETAKLPKYIKANGKRYRPIYDASKLPESSRISLSLKYLPKKAKDIAEMLPYLTARMVEPMQKTFFSWKTLPHDQKHVEDYSEDLKQACYGDVYLVFKECFLSTLYLLRQELFDVALNDPSECYSKYDAVLLIDDFIRTLKKM